MQKSMVIFLKVLAMFARNAIVVTFHLSTRVEFLFTTRSLFNFYVWPIHSVLLLYLICIYFVTVGNEGLWMWQESGRWNHRQAFQRPTSGDHQSVSSAIRLRRSRSNQGLEERDKACFRDPGGNFSCDSTMWLTVPPIHETEIFTNLKTLYKSSQRLIQLKQWHFRIAAVAV